MFATKRVRIAAAALTVALLAGGVAAAVTSTASASPRPKAATSSSVTASPSWKKHHKPRLSLNRFNLNGYVINAKYTLGRNTGNTFQQTYKASTVLGVPIAGPYVGTKFPTEDYVALPIGNHELYVTWLDPSTFAIVDVFVMNFQAHTVYDYAPGSATPESAGTIKVVARGSHRIP
jgi:opacity protein-like surface antigen